MLIKMPNDKTVIMLITISAIMAIITNILIRSLSVLLDTINNLKSNH